MTPTRSLRRLVVMLCCAALSPTTVSADDEILEQVRAAWQARQERFERGKIVWSEKRSYAMGVLVYTGQDRRPDSWNPAVQGISTRCEFAFDGVKGRYHWEGTHWSELQGKFSEQSRTVVFDGREMRNSRVYKDGIRSFGMMEKRATGMDLTGITSPFEPVALAFRPMSPVFLALRLKDFTVRGPDLPIRDTLCVCLQTPPDRSGLQQILWLDPKHEFVVLRSEVLLKQGLLCRTDIEYDDSVDVVPSSWSLVRIGETTRKPEWSLVVEVESVEWNKPLPASEFTVAFPPGAVVNEIGSSVGTHVVRKDGSLRRIERGELRNATFEQLAETPSREELERASTLRQRVLIVAGIVTTLGAGLWWNRKRSSAPN